MNIDLVSLLVDDYDEAIAYFVEALDFTLVEDSPSVDAEGVVKRWVVVRPGAASTGLLLAEARGPEQERLVGRQFGGRVGLFLHVDDVDVAAQRMTQHGVHFLEAPREEPYGKVVVFEDRWGNRWDLLGPRP